MSEYKLSPSAADFLRIMRTPGGFDPDALWAAISDMSNHFGWQKEADTLRKSLAETRADHARLLALAYVWVKTMAGMPETLTDDRNRDAWKACRKMADTDGWTELAALCAQHPDCPAFSSMVKDNLPRLHRTLMQSVTGFLLCAIAGSRVPEAEAVSKAMADMYGYTDWYWMPYI